MTYAFRPPENFLGLPPEDTAYDDAKVLVLPIPYEGTVSYGRGAANGPALITFNKLPLIMLLRPFESLPANERLKMAANEVGAELDTRYQGAKISVDPRFGRWDPTAGKVVGLGEG